MSTESESNGVYFPKGWEGMIIWTSAIMFSNCPEKDNWKTWVLTMLGRGWLHFKHGQLPIKAIFYSDVLKQILRGKKQAKVQKAFFRSGILTLTFHSGFLEGKQGSTVLVGTKSSLGILNTQIPNVASAASNPFHCFLMPSLVSHCWTVNVPISTPPPFFSGRKREQLHDHLSLLLPAE